MNAAFGDASGVAVESKPIGGLTVLDSMAGQILIKAFASHTQAFTRPRISTLAPIAGQRIALADRRNHLAVPALLPLHMDRDDRVRRRTQQEDGKTARKSHKTRSGRSLKSAENGCPFRSSSTGAQQGSKNVDHRPISKRRRDTYQHYAGFRCPGGSAMACAPRE